MTKSREFTKQQRDIVVLLHNIRSVQNVGAIIRTCECLSIKQCYATGYTPNLEFATDGSNLPILPHVKAKLERELHRSALGAEQLVKLSYRPNINQLIQNLKQSGYRLIGLEQNQRSVVLSDYHAPAKIALLLGEEVHGITSDLLEQCDDLIEIPMFGVKESYNVSVATGIALYSLTISSLPKLPR